MGEGGLMGISIGSIWWTLQCWPKSPIISNWNQSVSKWTPEKWLWKSLFFFDWNHVAVKLLFASHFCTTYFARRHVVDHKYGQTNAQSVRRWRLHTCAVHILVWCILVNCILVNCILVNCILVNCILVNCILGNCLLVNCILVNCTLVNCILVNRILVCWKQRQNKCSSVCGEVKARCYPSIGCCHTQGPAMCHQHTHCTQAQIQKYITHIQKYKVTHRGQPCVINTGHRHKYRKT